MWKGYILEIYSRDLERRLTFKSQGEKNTKMEIASAIERQMPYFKTQCDVCKKEKQYNIGLEENWVSLKLLVLFLQDATNGIVVCVLLTILINRIF